MTVCMRAAEVVPEKFASPLYLAVIECEPADKLDTDSCAALLETVAVPRDVAPSRKVIVPVALLLKAVWMLAESVISWPKVDGLALEMTEVVVDVPFTI